MNKIYGMTEEDKINIKKQFNYIVKNSCPIRTRIGNFIGKDDYWFILHPNQDCSPIKDLICSTLQNKVLPLLKQHQYLNDLCDLIGTIIQDTLS